MIVPYLKPILTDCIVLTFPETWRRMPVLDIRLIHYPPLGFSFCFSRFLSASCRHPVGANELLGEQRIVKIHETRHRLVHVQRNRVEIWQVREIGVDGPCWWYTWFTWMQLPVPIMIWKYWKDMDHFGALYPRMSLDFCFFDVWIQGRVGPRLTLFFERC